MSGNDTANQGPAPAEPFDAMPAPINPDPAPATEPAVQHTETAPPAAAPEPPAAAPEPPAAEAPKQTTEAPASETADNSTDATVGDVTAPADFKEPAGTHFDTADLSAFGGHGERAGQVLLSESTDNGTTRGDVELWSAAESAAKLRGHRGESPGDTNADGRGDISDQARQALTAAENARYASMEPHMREAAKDNHEAVLAYIDRSRNPGHVAAMLDAV